MKKGEISFELRNDLSELDRLREILEGLGEAFGLGSKAVFQINLALDELVTNIVSYGYADDLEHWIAVTMAREKDVLSIRVEDDGVPFNPLEMPAPDQECPLEERPIGGLGIHFVKRCMDRVAYERRGSRNILMLSKNLKGD